MSSPDTPLGEALRFIGDIAKRLAIVRSRTRKGAKSALGSAGKRRSAQPADGNVGILGGIVANDEHRRRTQSALRIFGEIEQPVHATVIPDAGQRVAQLGRRRVGSG